MFGWNFGGGGGDDGGGGGGGFFGSFMGGQMPTEFSQDYQCFPSSFAGREEIDKGNKIILPTSALDMLARLNISYPMLFRLSAGDMSTHCGVLEFVAEEGTCYLPYWMMRNLLLNEGDIVTVTNVSLPQGSYVKLQPVTKDFLDIHNPKVVLENALRHYATLTTGDNIVIPYNSKVYEIEIVATKPKAAVSIIEADIEVDFAPPKDYVEPTPPSSNLATSDESAKPVENDKNSLFGGVGLKLNGKPAKPIPQKIPSDDPFGPEPWLKRIPGGVRRNPPYGFIRKGAR